MKNLRKSFDRYCYQNRRKGIPNLMFYITVASALVYLFTMIGGNTTLYRMFYFDRALILKGQVWRLFSYVILYGIGTPNIVLVAIGLFCYYSLGRAIENFWGTLKFNLFYLFGIVLMDVYALIFNCQADVFYLNLSLLLTFATLYPDATFLIFFIIPVKAWILAVFNLVIILFDMVQSYFPYNLFPLVSLLNYFLFLGKDVVNVLPPAWRLQAKRNFGKQPQRSKPAAGPIPFNRTGSYQSDHTTPKPGYTHRCTICGRTDVSNPELEFRYCSKCNGYHCYCSDHINNHTHVQ